EKVPRASDYQVKVAVTVKVASADAVRVGINGDRLFRSKAPVSPAKENRNGIAAKVDAAIRSRNIGSPVVIEVRDHHLVGASLRGEALLYCEFSVAFPKILRNADADVVGCDEVAMPVVVVISSEHGHGSCPNKKIRWRTHPTFAVAEKNGHG